jgi:hypothetical protein
MQGELSGLPDSTSLGGPVPRDWWRGIARALTLSLCTPGHECLESKCIGPGVLLQRDE